MLSKDDILIIGLTLFSAPSLLPSLAARDLSQQVEGNLAEAGVFQVQCWPMIIEKKNVQSQSSYLAAQPQQTHLLTRPWAGHTVHPVVRDPVTRIVDFLLVTLILRLSPDPHLTLAGPRHLGHSRHLRLVRRLEIAGVGLGGELARVPGPEPAVLPLPALCLAVLCAQDVTNLSNVNQSEH